VPGGRDLLPSEVAVDIEVCPGDSGSGLLAPDGTLIGSLARSIGGTNGCAHGVYTLLDQHALLLGRVATAAGGAPWVASLGTPHEYGGSCDDDADCATGTSCRTDDGGLTYSCAKKCGDAYCFASSPAPDPGGCHASPNADTGALACFFLLAVLWRRRR
jgi:uncharacterized protein (TIGR03382 family)